MIETRKIDFRKYNKMLEKTETLQIKSRIIEATGLLVKAYIPGAKVGELCKIFMPGGDTVEKAEIIGFMNNMAYIMPFSELDGIGLDSEVLATGLPFAIKVSPDLTGRILDGLGAPIDDKGAIEGNEIESYPVEACAPNPLKRLKIGIPFKTGIKAIDGILTCGEGQRIGLFSGAGAGKSTLLGMIARNASADVNVIALVGERGREVKEFIEDILGEEGMRKSVVVVATSDKPALARIKAGYVATAVAEYFRGRGQKVLFMMDSITRFARALREVGLSRGEPPTRHGFPPSVFSILPRLVERTGNSEKGSITAFYTVLVEGDDPEEPVSDEMRSLLDGHIMLSRKHALENHYPAIDILRSISRVMDSIVTDEHRIGATKLREVLEVYEQHKELITIGALKSGSNERTDYALKKIHDINAFLKQDKNEKYDYAHTVNRLVEMFRREKEDSE